MSKPASRASRSLRPGARDLVLADLRDRGADDAAERRVAAGHVDADDPALLVRVRAERDRDRPVADAVVALDAVAGGPHVRRALVAMRASVAIPPLGPISMPACAASATFGFTPSPSTTMSAGDRAVADHDRAHAPSASVSNASTVVSVMSVDAEPADRVGDERAHVGIERRASAARRIRRS